MSARIFHMFYFEREAALKGVSYVSTSPPLRDAPTLVPFSATTRTHMALDANSRQTHGGSNTPPHRSHPERPERPGAPRIGLLFVCLGGETRPVRRRRRPCCGPPPPQQEPPPPRPKQEEETAIGRGVSLTRGARSRPSRSPRRSRSPRPSCACRRRAS